MHFEIVRGMSEPTIEICMQLRRGLKKHIADKKRGASFLWLNYCPGPGLVMRAQQINLFFCCCGILSFSPLLQGMKIFA
jgi:hypothetical protein